MPHQDRRARSAHPLARFVLCQLLVATQSLTITADADGHPTHPGKWTGTMNWNGTAVNLILLPGGPSGHHSRVLYWDHDDDAPVIGNVFGWDPPDDAATNSGSFPTAQFTPLTLDDPPLYLAEPGLDSIPSNLFCAGQTLLSDGRLLVTGGTSVGEAGNRSGLILDPTADANGQWTRVDNMAFRRWYSNNTLLPDGREVTASGSAFQEFVSFGGLVGAPSDSATRMFQRIGVDQPGKQEPSVVPLQAISPQSPIDAVSDAAVASISTPQMVVFGGRGADGQPVSNAYRVARDRNDYGADYAYQWTKLTKSGSAEPTPRFGAALVALSSSGSDITGFLLVGGRSVTQVLADAWRGAVTPNGVVWTSLHNYTPGTPLPALHGLNAVYDGGDGRTNRVFLFGGSASTTDDAPTNGAVYSLQLGALPTSDTLMVTIAAPSGNPPGALSYASLSLETGSRGGMPGDPTVPHRRAMLFGGYVLGGGYSDALYSMWIKSANEVVWEAVSPDGLPRPSGRARHAAAIDANTLSLVVYGGETAAGQSAADGWMFDVTCGGSFNRCDLYGNHHWKTLPALPLAIRGSAAAVFGTEPAFSRFPEIFTPIGSTGQWTTLATPHWQEWFPFGFVAPRGPSGDELRVFYAGPDFVSSMLHLSPATPTWAPFPSSSGTWRAGSAVMYKPGKVMKCGTRDTGGILPGDIVGRTATIDLNAATPTWLESAPADTMLHRRNHNLVILPSGEVLVVGGARWGGNDVSTDANCVKMPQIWNPDTLAAGHWYGSGDGMAFDPNPVRRHYHSTALLLPDGRVLSASGAFDDASQKLADLYSPYYLFNANGTPRTRPMITSAPARVSYGERFTLCMSSADNALSKVSFIRPAATTHAFDQNQRFVPLAFQQLAPSLSGDQRFLVSAPADSFDAPPGDYMLFVLNAAGTPAIARWIQLRATSLDTDPPTTVTNLHKLCGHGTWAELEWTPPFEDNAGGSCPGPAGLYDIRWSLSPITTDAAFNAIPASNRSAGPPPADPYLAMQSTGVYDLTDGLQYYFRMKSKDYSSGSGNWSAMSNQLAFVLHDESCGGSGGGGGCCHEDGLTALGGGNLMVGTSGGTAADPSFIENTLLPNAPLDVVSTDLISLPYGPKSTAMGSQVRLSQAGMLATRYTGLRLLGITPNPGEELLVAGHEVVSGTLTDPIRVIGTDGQDLTARFAADSAFDGRDGDTLVVQFADPGPGRISLETSRSQLVIPPDRTGIDIQCENAKGWQTVAHHDPRELASQALYDLPSRARVRLVFMGEHRLHGVRGFVPGTTPAVSALEPTNLVHSRSGDVTAALGAGGVLLSAGDNALADFAATSDGSAGLQWFLEVTGEHVATSGTSIMASLRDPGNDAPPLRFALGQNRPNPFAAETRVDFELPVRSLVRLEVFDLLGRRVATLASASYEPGRYSVSWDRRGRSGAHMPAGIYTCRYTAGDHREQRRMIVLP